MSAGDPASATVSSMARARVLTALVVALAAGVAFDVAPAHAGLRTTAWNFDSETVPARQAELELWLTNLVAGVDGAAGTTSLLVAPVIGLVDGVELALPMTFDYSRADGATTMGVYGAEVRWRLAPSLLGRKTGWVPLLRAGARRSPASDEQVRLLGTAVLGGNPTPELHVVANLGVVAITDPSAVALRKSSLVRSQPAATPIASAPRRQGLPPNSAPTVSARSKLLRPAVRLPKRPNSVNQSSTR